MAAALPSSRASMTLLSSRKNANDTGKRKTKDYGLSAAKEVEEPRLQPISKVAAGLRKEGSTLKQKSSEKLGIKNRQNSLRKVKTGTEVLKERESLKRQRSKKGSTFDGTSSGREGREYTVANVGNNGMIYLRPVKRPAQEVPQIQISAFPTGQTSLSMGEKGNLPGHSQSRDSVWTHLSTSMKAHEIPSRGSEFDVHSRSKSRPKRSMSTSTVDIEHSNERLESGAFKIVIDRAESIPDSESGPGTYTPALEVPIPHYRLGTPRFSSRGTAFLHNSVYTGSSAEDVSSSGVSGVEYDRLFPKPPGMETPSTVQRRHSQASPSTYSVYSSSAQARSARSTVPRSSVVHQKGPILPSIYDALASNPDDPSIVRYSPTGEIAAASPARLIAQITSENFLDYELLSDFFLTVRAYLSTQDLLSYLLARFEWAINRFDDNGRVIRVRAFAALRHWILNYFSYDFVVDRDLRVQFCDRLNMLTQVVKARANYGASDLKLISDLKKCWNGRCMLYWDGLMSTVDNQADVDIQPGGILGSRDSQLVHPSQLQNSVAPVPIPNVEPNPAHVASGIAIADWYKSVMEHGEKQTHGHTRHASTVTSRSLPISPTSERSIPVLSCSIPIPAKGFRKMTPYTNPALGVHPTPHANESRPRACPAAPSSLANEEATRPQTSAHRRSGSFSDAARDRRAPLSSEVPNGIEEDTHVPRPFAGGLIRGNVVSPGQPFVNFNASKTPAIEISRLALATDTYGTRKLGAPNNPGMKNLIGNIRRALSSKQNVNSPGTNLGAGSGSAPSLFVSRSGSLPMNVIYQAASTGQLVSFRSVRIDILSVEIAEVYRRATTGQSSRDSPRLSTVEPTSKDDPSQNSPNQSHLSREQIEPPTGLRPAEISRIPSGVTDGSQSIFIVDDTGLDMSELDVNAFSISQLDDTSKQRALQSAMNDPSNRPLSANPSARKPVPNSLQDDRDSGLSKTQNSVKHEALGVPESSRQFSTNATRKDAMESKSQDFRSSMLKEHSHKPSKSGSISLRKYASYQSTFAKHGHDKDSISAIMTSSDQASLDEMLRKAPAHILRRRPGGDLRANQNVHDMEQFASRPRSTGSFTTYTESFRSSQIISFSDKMGKATESRESSRGPQLLPPKPLDMASKKPASMVRSHSSQPELRRPSFQAAVAEFARIPDDDEGGIEATLLKLEGRYQKSPVHSPTPQLFPEGIRSQRAKTRQNKKSNVENIPGESSDDDASMLPLPKSPESDRSSSRTPSYETRENITSTLYADSEDSYHSAPFIEHGLDDDANEFSLNDGHDTRRQPSAAARRRILSRDVAHDTDMRNLRHLSYAPTATTDSFLLDEDDDFLSDLSSDCSIDLDDRDDSTNQWIASPTHEQGQQENTMLFNQHPPSPPMTMEHALLIAAQSNQAHERRKPPTPDPSPTNRHVETTVSANSNNAQKLITGPGVGLRSPRHMPFILGYDSELLAQQFTVVEKDALNEIDWRDLVDMRWQNAALTVTNWVDYLSLQDAQGIDLVTARFNLMVKWALSEIVLTESIDERALTLVKFIHIAHEARKIHNYATLLQITIALTSIDCTRLTKTWELVPAAEKNTLRDLEALVSPRRNFNSLRVEMEKASSDEGCIPVVALYIHDLTYNSQKPAQVPSTGRGEPLINFERYRCSSLIVKNLLRLIDASSKYTYQAADGAIDRCVWMASLPEDTITARSKQLEAVQH